MMHAGEFEEGGEFGLLRDFMGLSPTESENGSSTQDGTVRIARKLNCILRIYSDKGDRKIRQNTLKNRTVALHLRYVSAPTVRNGTSRDLQIKSKYYFGISEINTDRFDKNWL